MKEGSSDSSFTNPSPGHQKRAKTGESRSLYPAPHSSTRTMTYAMTKYHTNLGTVRVLYKYSNYSTKNAIPIEPCTSNTISLQSPSPPQSRTIPIKQKLPHGTPRWNDYATIIALLAWRTNLRGPSNQQWGGLFSAYMMRTVSHADTVADL
ncbi:unnamed protein product [Tuber melanosporum]|uniref:(Perigord truffle) hypothetical protein n=1 Tax=Tuber melanosporum (strain Mel28) TaxID=656061 RepID=D5GG10_TUBMM|nr:uncharacterized protein GSTUM_00007146001 [Tuber melanosporum]CAZ83453.1 unnamed protein product [Tuber melanosporum]